MKSFTINFNDKFYQCNNNETLLDAFLRQGVELTFSCRKGSCQACMMRCVDGVVSEQSQKGLRKEYVTKNYFLPCSCIPVSDMNVESILEENLIRSGVIHEKEMLSESICRLFIELNNTLEYFPGQFIRLMREDGLSRSYSLASMPSDYLIELHIKKMPNGRMSNWIVNDLNVGDLIELQGPFGDCVYHGQFQSEKTIVLIGKSSGLAPLIGVMRDALHHQHTGSISVYHFADIKEDIYCGDILLKLSKDNNNVHVEQNVIADVQSQTAYISEIINEVTSSQSDISNIDFYIAGSSSWVGNIESGLIQRGVKHDSIFTDPFEYHDLRKNPNRKIVRTNTLKSNAVQNTSEGLDGKKCHAEGVSGIWRALECGAKLRRILEEFYKRVYMDDRLSPFFHNTTIDRSIEKQFLFLRQRFTGEKVYFGDRPRNAHHWMVISNELFDYRKSILLECMKNQCLEQEYINEWIDYEESLRGDIVKSQPFPKVVNGIEFPLNGYETIQLDIGTLCDSCQGEIGAGKTVRYHVRLGLTYCEDCMKTEVD